MVHFCTTVLHAPPCKKNRTRPWSFRLLETLGIFGVIVYPLTGTHKKALRGRKADGVPNMRLVAHLMAALSARIPLLSDLGWGTIFLVESTGMDNLKAHIPHTDKTCLGKLCRLSVRRSSSRYVVHRSGQRQLGCCSSWYCRQSGIVREQLFSCATPGRKDREHL
jgi:hypothetical protein